MVIYGCYGAKSAATSVPRDPRKPFVPMLLITVVNHQHTLILPSAIAAEQFSCGNYSRARPIADIHAFKNVLLEKPSLEVEPTTLLIYSFD